jgi:hypothetical protein
MYILSDDLSEWGSVPIDTQHVVVYNEVCTLYVVSVWLCKIRVTMRVLVDFYLKEGVLHWRLLV